MSLLFNILPRSVPALVWGQSLPRSSGSVFRQPVAQHFHSMVPKLAVRAKAQHGSGRQQFWEGLPEHRLEASRMPPLSWDLPETPPGKAMPCRSPGARKLSSLDLPWWAWRLPWWILFLSTSPPGWSRTFSRWVAGSQLKVAKVTVKIVFTESACQCRRHRFNPWSGKIPPAT